MSGNSKVSAKLIDLDKNRIEAASNRVKTKIPAKQLGGVENPATVLLIPANFSDSATLWSHDGILLGGIKCNGGPENFDAADYSKIFYLPNPIPRSWGQREFAVVVEYEGEDPEAEFVFRVYYGCGDPSELHLGESQLLKGVAGSKQRLKFTLNNEYLFRNELFRATLEIRRNSAHPVLVYGAWLELAV